MDSLLIIDIGTGTQDILIHRRNEPIERSPKLVLPSPTVVKAGQITQARKDDLPIVLEGFCMGGGPIVRAVREHLMAGLEVYATEKAALTIHDSAERVKGMGVKITAGPVPDNAVRIRTSDYMGGELRGVCEQFGIPYPDAAAFAVQDHGFSPGRSNRIVRFELIRNQLEKGDWSVYALAPDPPRTEMSRMHALREQVPGVLVIDTGPAAVIGMLCDPWVQAEAEEGITLVNAGNGHTLCFTLKGERVHGVFEHHTFGLTPQTLGIYIDKLRNGTLTSTEIFESGGHGAVVREPMASEAIAVTGPNRRLLLPRAYQAAPFGDMMLTGCFGVLRVWHRLRNGVEIDPTVNID